MKKAYHSLMHTAHLFASAAVFQIASWSLGRAIHHKDRQDYHNRTARRRLFGYHGKVIDLKAPEVDPADMTGFPTSRSWSDGITFEDEDPGYEPDLNLQRAVFTAATGRIPGMGKSAWVNPEPEDFGPLNRFHANLQELKNRGVKDHVTNRLNPEQAEALVAHERMHAMLDYLTERGVFNSIDPVHPDYVDQFSYVPPCNSEK